MSESVIRLENVSIAFGKKNPVSVTDNVSFEIRRGEFFALVGESGSGKSVTAMSILRLLPVPSAQIISGKILFENKDLLKLSSAELTTIRGKKISCIFQEPSASLNPVMKIKQQLLEVLPMGVSEKKIEELMRLAGFSDISRVLKSYPHELSGGMLQRICIVMALLPEPSLLIADEPTTALDVTVQASVMEILRSLSLRLGTAVLFITHNMALVSRYADFASVMYAGRIVESGPAKSVIEKPIHPYTQALLKAIPSKGKSLSELSSISGAVGSPSEFLPGCRFFSRCPRAKGECAAFPPRVGKKHFAFCFQGHPPHEDIL